MNNSQYFSIKNNNLNLMSLILAIGVIYSHSFPVSLGFGNADPLSNLSNSQISVGGFAVNVLFIISGFLIANSYTRSKSNFEYLKARVLRIFPALIITTLMTAFIIGILIGELGIMEYLAKQEVYEYIINNLTLGLAPGRAVLPGVFENNIFGNATNSSLWTLFPQLLLYIGLMITGTLGLLKKRKIVLFLWIAVYSLYAISKFIDVPLDLYIRLANYFFLGVVFFVYHGEINYKNTKLFVFILCLIGLTFAIGQGFNIVFGIFGAYFVFYLAFYKKIFPKFDNFGDISYGVYIYAFPIQQLLVSLSDNKITPNLNFIISTIIVLILATLSWYLIEKPALSLKNRKFLKEILSKQEI